MELGRGGGRGGGAGGRGRGGERSGVVSLITGSDQKRYLNQSRVNPKKIYRPFTITS